MVCLFPKTGFNWWRFTCSLSNEFLIISFLSLSRINPWPPETIDTILDFNFKFEVEDSNLMLMISTFFYIIKGFFTILDLRGYDCMRQTKTRPENFWFSKFLNQMKPMGEKKHQKKFQPISSTNGWATVILIFGPHSRPSSKKIEFYA